MRLMKKSLRWSDDDGNGDGDEDEDGDGETEKIFTIFELTLASKVKD